MASAALRTSSSTGVRQAELARICAAGRTAGAKLIIVDGAAGVGKTWLAHAALDALRIDRVIAGAGKYGAAGALDGEAGLTPLFMALSELVEEAIAGLFDPQRGIASLTDSLGIDLDVLISAGLSVTGISPACRLSPLVDPRAGVSRIAAAAVHLIRWTDKFAVGRALLIDDWQRASPQANQLLGAILDLPCDRPLTVLLTRRETPQSDQLLPCPPVLIERLEPLARDAVANLLAESLGDQARADVAMATLGSAAPRLPFDIVQLAEALRHANALQWRDGRWVADAPALRVLAFDAPTRIAALSDAAVRTAGALALWGDAAPTSAFRVALADSSPDELDAALTELHAGGVAIDQDGRIGFTHDKLRDAVCHATAAARPTLAAAMAERLAPAAAESEVEIAALRLRIAGGLDVGCERWRDRFASGASAARGRGDSAAAVAFAEAALTAGGGLEACRANRARPVLREALLAAADRNSADTVARARALLDTAAFDEERFGDYELGIVALRLARLNDQAWVLAREGLRSAGIAPPRSRPMWSFLLAAGRWWLSRPARVTAVGADAGGRWDAFTGMASAAASLAYHRDPRATAVIAFRASAKVRRSSLRSAYWLGAEAFLFAALGARSRAADSGERGLAIFPEQRVLRAMSLYQALYFGALWGRRLSPERDRFREVTRIGLLEGDLIFACYGLRILVMSGWRSGTDLHALLPEAQAARQQLEQLGEDAFLDEMESMVALLEGLTGRRPWSPELWRRDLPTRNHVIDLELSNLEGDWPETLRRAAQLEPVRRDYAVQVDSIVWAFHETVARLKCGFPARARHLRLLRTAARLNPADHAPKLALVEAERLRARGAARGHTLLAYALAVEDAAQADSRLDAALAAFCAADYAREAADAGLAQRYSAEAEQILQVWGIRAAGPALRPETESVAEARARADAAERADAAKARLLVHVGHELRTPLQALRSMLDTDGAERGELDVPSMRAVLDSLAAVVDDLDLEAGLPEECGNAPRPLLVSALLRSELSIWQGEAAIALTVDGAELQIEIAASRVRQIVRNLLSNAVKYGGGTPVCITLATVPTREGRAAITVNVCDSGPGVPADATEQIFEPFERGTFEGDGRGRGLGLALSRRIAERLGGSLSASNAVGKGACFTLTLEAPLAAEPCRTRLPDRSARILLVEDAALVRELLAATLRSGGHEVVEAESAAAALSAWRPGAFDLAILDIGLGQESGIMVLSTIRRSEPLPAILLTASSGGEAEAAARDDLALRVLRKPASAETLSTTIAELLGGMAPRQREAAAIGISPDLEPLRVAAQAEIARAGRACLAGETSPAALHKLAGLAAQFGWPEVADVAEAIELAAVERRPTDLPRARLGQLLAAMERA